MVDVKNTFVRVINFERNIVACWKELQVNNNFCDMTLACHGKQYQVHRFIISLFSPILKDILKINPSSHAFVYLRGINPKTLHNLITFIYEGEVNVEKIHLASFLEIAKDLLLSNFTITNEDNSSFQKDTPEFNYKHSAPYPKKNIESTKTVNNINLVTELEETFENLKNNDFISYGNDRYKFLELAERKKAIEKYKKIQKEVKNEIKNFGEVHKRVRYPCNYCDYKATQRSSILRHMASVHEEKYYPCRQCGNKYKREESLKEHVASSHEGVRYPCDYCDYKATHKPNIWRHMSSVHEGKLYPCSQCDFKGKDKSYTKAHESSVHNGVLYPCNMCYYTASLKKQLRSHLLKHHPEQNK